MRNFLNHILILFITFFLLFCSSGKKGIDIDDETPETLIEKAELAYKNKQYNDAIEICNLLLLHFPISDLHINAQLITAKSLGGKEKFEDQFDLLTRLIKENKIPEKVPLIFVQIADFYEHAAKWNPGNLTSDSLDMEKAAQFYRKAVFYPNSDDKATKALALYRAGLLNAKLDRIEIATRAYEHVVANYPESPYSTLAKIKLQNPSNTEEIDIESQMVLSLEQQRQEQLELSAEEAESQEPVEEEKLIDYPDEIPDQEVPSIMSKTTQEDSIQLEINEEQSGMEEQGDQELESEPEQSQPMIEAPPDDTPIMEIPEE